MAKLNARGSREVCAYTVERTVLREGVNHLYRERFALRSDGMILRRILWVDEEGRDRLKFTSGYSTWRRLKEGVPLTAETLAQLLQRMGCDLVDEAAERQATAKAAAQKRRDNQGPTQGPAHWRVLYARAHELGEAAAEAVTPTPMVVQERENPLDDNSPVVRTYAPIMDGPCGFAYVKVRPANGSFGRWAKAERGWRPAYGGGLEMSVHAYGQSMTRKQAYAQAFAEVLRTAGVNAYGYSRMD